MIKIKENNKNVEEFSKLYDSVGLGVYSKEISTKALDNTFYSVSVYDDDKIIGYGRLIGEFYNIFSERLIKYLTKKVGEIAKAGANVIFERGLWSKEERKNAREYYKNNGIECELHYVCVDDETWKQNIAERNQRVLEGNGDSDFYLDEGLMKKLESIWEEPKSYEVDVIYKMEK